MIGLKNLCLSILFLLLPYMAVAQDNKWMATSSYGITEYGNTRPFNKLQYVGINMGYNINPIWEVGIASSYGFGNNNLYNVSAYIGREVFSLDFPNGRYLAINTFIGIGYQYIDTAGGMMSSSFRIRATIPLTRNTMFGVESSYYINSVDEAILSYQLGVLLGIKF